MDDPAHKLWACILKKQAKIKAVHCSCMSGMYGTCNHVAAMLFRVEAARLGLTNPACTTNLFEWLPNRKDIQPTKVKNISFCLDDFGKRGKKIKAFSYHTNKKLEPFSQHKC